MLIAAAFAATVVVAIVGLIGAALFAEREFRRNGFHPKD